jgi:cytochrome bd ubiquinol oxidase subunit I
VLVVMSFSGWIAVVAGWYTTEMGRQPWLVHGILRTAEAAAPNVGSGLILTSLAMYLLLYLVLIVAYVSVLFYLARKAGDASPAPEATS